MEFFTFSPEDVQVLEDIEFDEEVQRPEKIRFYTLEEQTVDAFERMVPRGRVTKFQLNRLKDEVDRVKNLYETYVVATPEDYALREPTFGKRFNWIFPVYASPDLKAYSFAESYSPLFEDTLSKGFYPRLLSALPNPFAPSTQGLPYAFTNPQEFVDMEGREPLRALPTYNRTRAQIHEDRTVDIVDVPVEGTADTMSFVGYYLQKRPLDIPNPLPDHPFFKANEPTLIETTSALADVVPSIDAILEHGVPTTKDPYTEAQPFLKIYDVSLRDIPWRSWKVKFPQADVIADVPPAEEIPFPVPKANAPSENITSAYKSSYQPGLAARYWLGSQVDGGELVIQMLLSEAIANGSVEAMPGVDLGSLAYPETTIEECDLLGKSFQDFTTQGSLRRTWGEKDKVTFQCVPLEFVKQERARLGYKNRKQWKEDTGTRLLQTHLRALESVRLLDVVTGKTAPEVKSAARPDSVVHLEVVAILDDSQRFAEDKLRDIKEVVKNTTLSNKVYLDEDNNKIVCSHTLAILGGEFAEDSKKFFADWTANIEGNRVCRFCGEEISRDTYKDQDEYDVNGFKIQRTDALEQPQQFRGDSLAGFVSGLQAIKEVFQLQNPVDDTMFLLISILQILPKADNVDTLLKIGRTAAFKQFGTKDTTEANKFRGAIGIVMTILLIQMHIPTLVPRRAFGSKPLKLNGFPRDVDKPEPFSIVDTMLMVLRRTFEAYPTTFKGPSNAVIRAILNKPADIKNAINVFLNKVFLPMPDIRTGLASAKAHQIGLPPVEQPKTLIPIVMPPEKLDILTKFPPCPSARPIWSSGRPPRITQKSVPLRTGLEVSKHAVLLEPSASERERPEEIPRATIQARLSKKKSVKFVRTISEDPLTNLTLASYLSDIFHLETPVRNVNPSVSPDLLRDIAQGYVYDLLSQIQADPVKARKLSDRMTKDVTLYMLFADYKEEKSELKKVRARERMTFVQRMADKTDEDREVIEQHLRLGTAPYIITNQDRVLFARQAEELQEQLRMAEPVDEGVGQPRDTEDQEDEFVGGTDYGDYGDRQPLPNVDGRDHPQPSMLDDEETSI
jgi:hypothetical protein